MVETSLINQEYKVVSHHQIAEVRISNSTNQQSLHALRSYAAGEVFIPFTAGITQSSPTYLTVQTGLNRHITLKPEFLQYINHSCEPNVFFDTTDMNLVCLQPLQPGDEMCFFYPSTEWDMDQPFVCNCGSSKCLQLINGAANLTEETLKRYRLSDFIRQQLKHRL
jgi:SET domain